MGGKGCKIFDLKHDPMNPKLLVAKTNNFISNSECHDSHVQTINKRDILISSDGYAKKWRLSDITDLRDNPTQLPLISSTPRVRGSVYAHDAATSDDGQTLFVFDEFNNFDIGVYDISDINSPKLIRQFQWSNENEYNSIVHNGFVRGNYLFVAYYEAGLRVFDISNIKDSINEVGHYETWRDPNGDGILSNEVNGRFNGAWNLYVGFSSGKVLVSDIKHGIFVLTIHDDSCIEESDAEFFFKIGLKEGKRKKCNWLRKQNRSKIAKICRTSVDSTASLPAPENICRKTCKTCNPCYENDKAKFFHKFANNKVRLKSCDWLQKGENDKWCSLQQGSFEGYSSPRKVFPVSCAHHGSQCRDVAHFHT